MKLLHYLRYRQVAALFFGCLLWSSTVMAQSVQEEPLKVAEQQEPVDSFEKYNRFVFRFNDVLDRAVLVPIALAYQAVLPAPLRTGIANFFNNINTVPVLINDGLQGHFYQATADAWRLVINTTIGVVGIFDVAKEIGLEPNLDEDLGLTFAQWGWTESSYFVLPFLGSSTLRDALGKPIEARFMTIYPYITPVRDRYLLLGLGLINTRAQLLKFDKLLQESAIDKYVFLRDAYLQRRAYLIKRNHQLNSPNGDVPDVDYSILDDT